MFMDWILDSYLDGSEKDGLIIMIMIIMVIMIILIIVGKIL